jgi:site-specific DNA recombinase
VALDGPHGADNQQSLGDRPMTETVGAYVRKSNFAATGKAEKSVEVQRREIEAYAARQGWQLDDRFVFADDDVSGSDFTRESKTGFYRMLATLDSVTPPFTKVIVTETERLGRDTARALNALRDLEELGVEVYSVTEGQLGSSDIKTMVTAWAGEHERTRVIERVSRALNTRHADKKATGGAPFGLQTVPVEGTAAKVVRPHPEQRLVVERIFTLAAAGLGLHRIAKTLASEGIKAPARIGAKGIAKYAEKGVPVPERLLKRAWTSAGVYEILHRDDYRGLVWRGRRVNKKGKLGKKTKVYTSPDKWTKVQDEGRRIISDELWDRAHAQLAENTAKNMRAGKHIVGRAESFKGRYLLSTLVVCALCGRPMIAMQRGRNLVVSYVCASRRDNGACANSTGVPAKLLHKAVIDALKGSFNAQSFECHLMKAANDTAAAASREREIAHLTNTKLPALTAKVANLVAAVVAGGGDIPELVSALQAAKADKAEAEARLATLKEHEIDVANYRAEIAKLRDRWQDWQGVLEDPDKDINLARQLIKKLLSSPVFVTPGAERGVWEWAAAGSYEGPLKGFIGRRAPAVQVAAQPHELAATIRAALLARCGARPPRVVDAETVRRVVAGGSDAAEDGGCDPGSASGPPT